jgi:hypothetical protein
MDVDSDAGAELKIHSRSRIDVQPAEKRDYFILLFPSVFVCLLLTLLIIKFFEQLTEDAVP